MQTVVLVTVHYLRSKRRAGFHFLADAYWRAGWNVVFFTIGLSYLSRFRGDHRFQYPIFAEANRVNSCKERLSSYVWLTRWHPVNLRNTTLNKLTTGLFSKYGSGSLGEGEELFKQAHLILFESSPGIMMTARVKQLNPRARMVYRVSDDIRLTGFHPVVCEAEQRVAPLFDLISLPSSKGFQHLRHLPKVAVHYHGLETRLFDQEYPNPYAKGGDCHAVSLGGMLFDGEALEAASQLFPNWTFHAFGWHGVAHRKNIKRYGEVPFLETIPYIKCADIGLALYSYRSGAEYLCDSSLKMKQYTYCQLPTVAPTYAVSDERPHVFGYKADSLESIRDALQRARAFDRTKINQSSIWTWDRLASILAGQPNMDSRMEAVLSLPVR